MLVGKETSEKTMGRTAVETITSHLREVFLNMPPHRFWADPTPERSNRDLRGLGLPISTQKRNHLAGKVPAANGAPP